MAFNT